MDNLFEHAGIKAEENKNTCLTCEHRERHKHYWSGKITQYCGVRENKRNKSNGKLKIKCKNKACRLWEKEK